jgi:pyruvate/2-oxoglutarate dehydrogenase complex dihydrolipoamide dehydrogenase (E3) component
VVGAGAAGEVAAGRVAAGGMSVAIVEERLVGGECSFYACMPSKALLRPVELRAEVARVPGLAGAQLDPAAVLARRDEVISWLDDASQLPWLAERGIELVRGRGTLAGEKTVRVGDALLVAREAVIVATGSAPAVPPVAGLAEARPWTNVEGTTARSVPGRLAVIGGGAVAVELAQAWAALGASVTLLYHGERLLRREEPFAGDEVRAGLEREGVDVRLRSDVLHVSRDGVVVIGLSDGTTLQTDEVLVATGRKPRTAGLGLETVGLHGGGWLEVDDRLRVPGVDWLYAVGDVNGRALLTHMGKYEGRIAGDVVLGRDARVRWEADLAPRVVFTSPQLGSVGLTLAAAEERGLRARAVDVPTGGNAGGSFVGRGAPGTSRLVVDDDRRAVVGATFTGPEVAESLHAATIAVAAAVPLEALWHAVPAFPTRSEAWLKLLEAYGL